MKKYLTGIFFICLFITGHAGIDPIRHYQNIILSSDTLLYPNPNAWANSDNTYIGQEYYKIYYRTYAYGDTLIYPNPNAWLNSDNAYFGWELYNIYLRTFPGGGGGGSCATIPCPKSNGTSGQVLTLGAGGTSASWTTPATNISYVKDSAWLLTGNSGTIPGTNYLGTNDNAALEFKVGKEAGYIDTIGRTIIGYQALYKISTGKFNTAFGLKANYTNTTASSNTAIGKNAAPDNTGSWGTFIGDSAGYNNVSGYDNTFIGYKTQGNSASGPTYNSTAIGYGSTITTNNQMVYGNNSVTEQASYGAISPGGPSNDGTTGQLLESQGAGTSDIWTTALANGITATTQAARDNSTKVGTTAYADNIYSNNDLAFQAIGISVKAFPVGCEPMNILGSTQTMQSKLVIYDMLYIPTACTITGIEFELQTAGSYVSANYNGFGLYSVNTSTGALTLVDSTTSSTTLFTATANIWTAAPLASTYSATTGLYMIGALWVASATTTAPVFYLYFNTANGAVSSLPTAHSMVFSGYQANQTVLGATRASSAITQGSYQLSLYLY